MERNISVSRKNNDGNCNGCGARNYESPSKLYNDRTPRVETLYNVHIGSHRTCLCADCLDALTMQIAVIRGAALLGGNHHAAQ